MESYGLGLYGSGQELLLAGFCEHSNEPSGSVKGRELLTS
jgi:hypothetical protein